MILHWVAFFAVLSGMICLWWRYGPRCCGLGVVACPYCPWAEDK